MPFVLAIGGDRCSRLAETFQTVVPNHAQVYLHVLLVTLIGLVMICVPLLLLVPMLYRCRRRVMVAFSALAHDYSQQFQRRWLEPDSTETGNPLGSGDIQSLADCRIYRFSETPSLISILEWEGEFYGQRSTGNPAQAAHS